MAQWRIESSKTGGRCLACDGKINKGEHRFGTPTKTRWFHLRCAAEGAPKAFPPFAKQAATLLSKAPPKPPEVSKAALARLLAVDGDGALEVLSDFLQTAGDPWGELIALRLAGEHDAALAHLDEHRASLYGGLGPGCCSWRDGVIVAAHFSGQPAALEKQLDRLAALRTAGRLSSLELEGTFSPALLRKVVATVPPSLEHLELRGHPSGLEVLDLPRLRSLRVSIPFEATVRIRLGPPPELDGLVEARLPALRVLRLTTHRPVSLAFLEKLLASKLLARLEWLDFDDESPSLRTLDDAGLRLLLAQKKRLAHIKALWVERAGRKLTPAEAAAAQAFFQARGQRALKRASASAEEELDEV